MLIVQYGYIFLVLIFLLLFYKNQNSENISHIVLCPVR